MSVVGEVLAAFAASDAVLEVATFAASDIRNVIKERASQVKECHQRFYDVLKELERCSLQLADVEELLAANEDESRRRRVKALKLLLMHAQDLVDEYLAMRGFWNSMKRFFDYPKLLRDFNGAYDRIVMVAKELDITVPGALTISPARANRIVDTVRETDRELLKQHGPQVTAGDTTPGAPPKKTLADVPTREVLFLGQPEPVEGSRMLQRCACGEGSNVLVVGESTTHGVSEEHRAALRVHHYAHTRFRRHVAKVELLKVGKDGPELVALEDAECTLFHLMDHEPRTRESIMRLLRLMVHTAEGVHLLHQRGVFHRGLNPYTVLVKGDRTMLWDLGLSTVSGATIASTTNEASITGSEAVMRYRAFEMITGTGDADKDSLKAADVYSLGVILNAILAGAEPYAGTHGDQDIVHKARDGDRPDRFDKGPTGTIAGLLSEAAATQLNELLDECLRLQPERRISAGALRDRLKVITGMMLTAGDDERSPPSPGSRVATAQRRWTAFAYVLHLLLWAAALLVAVAVVWSLAHPYVAQLGAWQQDTNAMDPAPVPLQPSLWERLQRCFRWRPRPH